MENKIISIDISPDKQGEINENAGVMWEHNATTLKFNIAPEYTGDYRYYIEYRSLLGTKVRTEYLELDTEKSTVTYSIPIMMTSLRGVECYFNIISIDEDGNTVQVVKPRKFCLTFDYSPDTGDSIAQTTDFSVNALFEAIRLGTFKGEQGEKGDSFTYEDFTEEQLASLKGEKGDSVVVDGEMSDNSENPVQNKIAKAYVDDKTKSLQTVFANENIFDEEKNSYFHTDTEYKWGTVYLNGTETYLVISSAKTNNGGPGGVYIINVSVYNENNEKIENVTVDAWAYSSGQTRSGVKVNIPDGSNAKKMMFKYRISHSTIGTLCNEMMVTVGDVIPATYAKAEYMNVLNNSPYIQENDIDERDKNIRKDFDTLVDELYEYVDNEVDKADKYITENFVQKEEGKTLSSNDFTDEDKAKLDASASEAYVDNAVGETKTYYVSVDGNDNNDGLSKETPFATLKKAVQAGAKSIAIKKGEYSLTNVTIQDKNDIHIYAYDDSESYSHEKPVREKAHLICGEYYTEYVCNSDGVYHCENVNKNVYGCVLIDNEEARRTDLTGVSSYDECVSTPETYYVNGTNMYFNTTNTTFTKVAKYFGSNVLVLKNCNNVLIEDISFDVSSDSVLDVDNCSGVVFNNCEANYSVNAMGFSIDYSNAILNNCSAYRNKFDGFNFHGYGTTVMNDCVSRWNSDDGCSHHDGCIGTINGGRFTGNGKCGIAPAYGANVNIYGVVCDYNKYQGIGYLGIDNGHATTKGIMNSCVMTNNGTGLEVQKLCDVIAIDCKYKDNTSDKHNQGTLVEF